MSLFDEYKEFRTIWTPEEDELRRRADDGYEQRHAYVEYYMNELPEYYSTGLRMIKERMDEFNKPECLYEGGYSIENRKLVEDIVYSLHRFGASYIEYFQFDFMRKSAEERNTFATSRRRAMAYKVINSPEGTAICENKEESYARFNRYYGRDVRRFDTCNQSSLKGFSNMLAEYGKLIVKPLNEMQGKGVALVTVDQVDACGLMGVLSEGEFLAEPCLENVDELRLIHPASLNTLRVETALFPDRVEFLTPFLRMGCGDSVVDNGGAGGIFANVDINTGVIVTKGHDEYGHRYTLHPDTGVIIPGITIPQWENALSLAAHLAESFPECKMAAWDLALTNDGWKLIEVNHNGHPLMQIADGVGVWPKMIEVMKAW
ncbi:MAG TPA: hypothetical protein K8U77_01625 [Slackia equolifaciens]|uniref:Alpha-L-glutamate ligase-related protein ATP-grasp domain-containing protein n=1 Tax=Slackia equolifaciens TaxID=498718 RepID=A0A9D3A0Q8_9ACTN|nr:hypothetical protein [Slackia equolifaciens]